MLDDWQEAIPNREEVSGITFNYNQPNSAPPQTILLAVTPEETGKWQWQHLVSTVLDTMQRAKERAVDPDEVEKIPGVASLLPATVSEFSTNRLTHISLDYARTIKEANLKIEGLYNQKK
jgi:hypothetical protein